MIDRLVRLLSQQQKTANALERLLHELTAQTGSVIDPSEYALSSPSSPSAFESADTNWIGLIDSNPELRSYCGRQFGEQEPLIVILGNEKALLAQRLENDPVQCILNNHRIDNDCCRMTPAAERTFPDELEVCVFVLLVYFTHFLIHIFHSFMSYCSQVDENLADRFHAVFFVKLILFVFLFDLEAEYLSLLSFIFFLHFNGVFDPILMRVRQMRQRRRNAQPLHRVRVPAELQSSVRTSYCWIALNSLIIVVVFNYLFLPRYYATWSRGN